VTELVVLEVMTPGKFPVANIADVAAVHFDFLLAIVIVQTRTLGSIISCCSAVARTSGYVAILMTTESRNTQPIFSGVNPGFGCGNLFFYLLSNF